MPKESKHVVKFKTAHLATGEQIVAWGDGYIGEMMGKGKDQQHNGSLIVTDQRVAFYRAGMFGQVLETMPLKGITSIERKSFMGHRSIRLHTSHDQLEFKTFDKDQEQSLVAAIETGRSAAASTVAPSAPDAPDAPDASDMLRKLAGLRDSGVLTEEEFSAKKAEILARI